MEKLRPSDKLMKTIFGDKWKTEEEVQAEIEAEIKAEADKYTGEEHKFDKEYAMLFVKACMRSDELKEMVDRISANKYFPNENYRNVFKWSVMQAAQWQYEKMMEGAMSCALGWNDGFVPEFTEEQMSEVAERLGLEVGDNIRVIIVKE